MGTKISSDYSNFIRSELIKICQKSRRATRRNKLYIYNNIFFRIIDTLIM